MKIFNEEKIKINNISLVHFYYPHAKYFTVKYTENQKHYYIFNKIVWMT